MQALVGLRDNALQQRFDLLQQAGDRFGVEEVAALYAKRAASRSPASAMYRVMSYFAVSTAGSSTRAAAPAGRGAATVHCRG